jgi:hypothetical protein
MKRSQRGGASVNWSANAGNVVSFSNFGSSLMKTIASALIALSVLAGVAAPANAAWDTKAFWENLARSAQ